MEERTTSRSKKRFSWRIALAIVIYAIGLLVLFYPVWSQYWNQRQQDSMIHAYEQSVDDQSNQTLTVLYQQAQKYNQALYQRSCDVYRDKNRQLNYNKQLSVPNSNVMAVLSVPSVDIHLPIYHGTSEQALEVGVGHMSETSLPVGGRNTHAVLTGHTGLPSGGTLFTPLVKLQKGQLFSIQVLGKTLYYQIDAIHVVKPNDLRYLAITPNQDKVTLLTCTPYGVNSHRLLVQGKRVPMDLSAPSNARLWAPWQSWLLVMSGIGLIGVIIVLLCQLRKKKKHEKNKVEIKD